MITEDQLEQLCLEWFREGGYEYAYGPEIANDRRAAIVVGNYVVIIRIYRGDRADFVTAFVAGQRTINQIRSNPLWT